MIEILIYVFLGISAVCLIATIILLLIMILGPVFGGLGKLDDFYYTEITPSDTSDEKDTETTFIDDRNISEN